MIRKSSSFLSADRDGANGAKQKNKKTMSSKIIMYFRLKLEDLIFTYKGIWKITTCKNEANEVIRAISIAFRVQRPKRDVGPNSDPCLNWFLPYAARVFFSLFRQLAVCLYRQPDLKQSNDFKLYDNSYMVVEWVNSLIKKDSIGLDWLRNADSRIVLLCC